MDNVINAVVEEVRNKIYPLTFINITYVIIITILTIMVTRFFLRNTLIKWLYVSSIIIIFANIYNGKSK